MQKTAKRHGLNTDASFRYERGVDPNIGMDALVLATASTYYFTMFNARIDV